MNSTVSKTASYLSLAFAILWFSLFALLELIYVIGVFRKEPGIIYAFHRISDDQLSTINTVVTIILLLPGIGAYKLYEKLSRNKEEAA